MRYLRVIVFGIVMVLLTGCAIGTDRHAYTYRADYNIELKEVERSAQAKQRYGEQKIMKEEEESVNKYFFEDQMVKIMWSPSPLDVSFILTNKTNHSIKIVWDDAAFVDENGVSHRVMHSGVEYTDRNNPKPPSVVVRNGTVTDSVIPTDKISTSSFIRQCGVDWLQDPLFPIFSKNAEELRSKAQKYIGKTIQVLLPLQIENVLNEYIFTFEVKSVGVK